MKNFRFILIYLFFAVPASAQKVYFIYLQTENQLPFYVKMGDRIQSSSSSGYAILSNLVDSTYNFSIGFPSTSGESRFAVSLGSKDRGFLIRKSDDGWDLVDLQTSSRIKPQNREANSVSYQTRNDAFTTLLSKVADDPGLLLIPVVAKEDVSVTEKKQEERPADINIPVKDSTAVVQTQVIPDVKKPEGDSSDNNLVSEKKGVTVDSSLTTSKTGDVQTPPVDTGTQVEVFRRSVV